MFKAYLLVDRLSLWRHSEVAVSASVDLQYKVLHLLTCFCTMVSFHVIDLTAEYGEHLQ